MAISSKKSVQWLVAACVLALMPAMVSAQSVTATEVMVELKREGFMVVDTGTTLLGRLRITAMGPEGTREVVLNPRNGKVLRDVIIEEAAEKPFEIAKSASTSPVVTEPLALGAAVIEARRLATEPVAHVAVAEPAAPAAAPGMSAQEVVQDRGEQRLVE